ncbi:EAL domain-containing protein [Rossellomorea aquimaris]|uniref:EAL domain-containing protein n=1 Tax=Rossellomorea aquimaris TaxID=189382 RepID=UPI0005C97CFA|nr:EAL domain-containing protein [Rossellomorea aquimaris]
MKIACANCAVTMKYHDTGYFFLHNNQNHSVPVMGYSTRLEDGTYVFLYENLKDLYEKLMRVEELMEKDGWKCSINCINQPGPFMTVGRFMLLMKHKEMVEMIQDGHFTSHLQPIVDLSDYSLFGYESLLRAGDQSKKINPGQLFEVAANTGFHSMLDQKARKSAIECRVGQVTPGIKSFINFLPSTIYNPEFCLRHTFQIVNELGLNPEDLVFEVVETEKIVDVEHLKSVLDVYKREGMKVALDDVGSGFATVEMLTLLNPDYVKIDRSFINHCDSDAENQEFLRKVMKIAGELDIHVLAEGIERKEELLFCKEIGVHYAQGYFIGKPARQAEKPFADSLLV